MHTATTSATAAVPAAAATAPAATAPAATAATAAAAPVSAAGAAGCGHGASPRVAAESGLWSFAFGNLQAMAKAGDICARGFRLLNTAIIGNAWMALDDGVAELQARMSCRSLGSLLELEADIGRRTVSRSVRRFCVLAQIAGQLGEDTLVPLQRRIDVVFDTLGSAAGRR